MINTTLRPRRRDSLVWGGRVAAQLRRPAGVAFTALLVGGATVGCGGDTGTVPALTTDPFMTAQLNVRSATMSTVAPYNTIQLTVTPYSATGRVLTDSISTTYLVKDSTLSVTPGGLVTALFVTSDPSWVVATVRDMAHNVTHVDTMFVTVTSTTPASPLSTFKIQQAPGDSTFLGVYDAGVQLYTDTLHVQVLAQDGSDLSSQVFVRFLSSDSSIAKVDPSLGIVRGMQSGHVMIRTMTTYYGVTKTDSLAMTITTPVTATIEIPTVPSPTVAGKYIKDYSPNTITIGTGGTVIFAAGFALNKPYLSWDVVFDDSVGVDSTTLGLFQIYGTTGLGNIGPVPPLTGQPDMDPLCVANIFACNAQARSFRNPGTYHYHSALYGTTGVVIVKSR